MVHLLFIYFLSETKLLLHISEQEMPLKSYIDKKMSSIHSKALVNCSTFSQMKNIFPFIKSES
jgi:hypothetical protein